MTLPRTFLFKYILAGAAVLLVVGLWRRDRRGTSLERPATVSAGGGESPRKADRGPGERRDGTTLADGKLDPKAAATVERIRRMLDSVEPVLPGEVQNAAALELLRWWAEIDPVAAIRFAAGHPAVHGRPELPVELFVAWLDGKNAEASQWFGSLEPGPLRAQLLPALISIEAGRRPQVALAWAAELEGDNRRTALSALFSEWSAVDPRAASDHARRLPDPREQNLALRLAMGKWMDRDMAAAIAWAKSLPPEAAPDSLDVFPPVIEILIEKWAAKSPADAAAHLVATAESAGRSRLLRTVAGQWAGANPTEALAWAARVDRESDRSVMVRGVLGTVAQIDVRAAADLALTLPSGIFVQQSLGVVLDPWIARDPAGVVAWATALVELSPGMATVEPVVTAWAAVDLGSVSRWLSQLPTGEARDAGCAALARYLAPRQPRLAAEWAETISNPVLRREQIEALARAR